MGGAIPFFLIDVIGRTDRVLYRFLQAGVPCQPADFSISLEFNQNKTLKTDRQKKEPRNIADSFYLFLMISTGFEPALPV